MSTQQDLVLASENTAVPITNDASGAMALVVQAVANGAPVETMKALIDLRNSMEDRTARQLFNSSMVACQSEMPTVRPDKSVKNKEKQVQSRYATLERIDEIIRPIYQKHGFSISFDMEPSANAKQTYVAVVRHSGGHSETYRQPLALDTSGSKNDTQAGGSTKSYARRYFLLDIFHIVVEGQDNDGKITVSTITDDQAKTIGDYLATTPGVSKEALLKWASESARTEILKVADIPASLFTAAIRSLEKKREAM